MPLEELQEILRMGESVSLTKHRSRGLLLPVHNVCVASAAAGDRQLTL
jgi:hypothetical protein